MVYGSILHWNEIVTQKNRVEVLIIFSLVHILCAGDDGPVKLECNATGYKIFILKNFILKLG